MRKHTDDRHRVRIRLSDDFKHHARLLNSELEFYAEHFNDDELSDLRDMHHDLERVGAMVEANTFSKA